MRLAEALKRVHKETITPEELMQMGKIISDKAKQAA